MQKASLLPFVIYYGQALPEEFAGINSVAYTYFHVSTEAELKEHLQSGNCYSVFIGFNLAENELNKILALCKTLNSAAARFVHLEKENQSAISELYNKYEVFKVYIETLNRDLLSKDLTSALLHYQSLQSQQKLVSEIKLQNQQLEELTINLEKTIEVRTQDELLSKKAIEDHVSSMRSINRFIRDLSTVVAVEEILIILRKEIKIFHKVMAPILIIKPVDEGSKIYSFHGSSIHVSDLVSSLQLSAGVDINNKDHKIFLANTLGRPLAQLLSIPIQSVSGEYYVFFENSLNANEQNLFIQFIIERIRFIEVTLDRVILDQEIKNASYLWEKTFEGIGEPISIVDEKFNLLRSNHYFNHEFTHCYEALSGAQSPCKGCPVNENDDFTDSKEGMIVINDRQYSVHTYPVISPERSTKTYINRYVDMTKYEDLHSQILQNEKMAAVGHLADHIAHELNNPLTGIRSMAQLLLTGLQAGSEIHSDLTEVEKASMRCQNIIKNLRNFSKQKGDSETKRVSLTSIVESTLPLLKTAMASVEVRTQLSEERNDLVEVEPQLIQQVVFNLINNSCQAMPSGGQLKVLINRVVDDEGESFIELTISDSGTGISSENLASIFDPFFTTKKQGEGTGLGLSVCKKIVERYGGFIQAESHVGKGTVFRVLVPSA